MSNKRPSLRKGDICKYHKSYGKSLKQCILVVLKVNEKLSSEAFTIVVANEHRPLSSGKWIVSKVRVLRKCLWKTGANVLTSDLEKKLNEMEKIVSKSMSFELMNFTIGPSQESTKPVSKEAKQAIEDWLKK